MTSMPFTEKDRIFERLANVANEATLAGEELAQYRRDQKAYTDLYNIQNTARIQGLEYGRKEGRAEGRAEALRESVSNMRNKGLDDKTISDLLGISISYIKKL